MVTQGQCYQYREYPAQTGPSVGASLVLTDSVDQNLQYEPINPAGNTSSETKREPLHQPYINAIKL